MMRERNDNEKCHGNETDDERAKIMPREWNGWWGGENNSQGNKMDDEGVKMEMKNVKRVKGWLVSF